ncbi:DUF6882 domain-containing protein [Streptomyces sp. NPDC042319]|uniref:DUF6882 domain-containing protein n=1 Tax=Streptomyces sp. NPDC042319 TaxID=3154332 RepID=UPI0033C21C78
MNSSAFSEAFVRTVQPYAAWGAEQLETFNAFLPEGDWSADLDQCSYRQGRQELQISVLGTWDVRDGSWLWGWANPGFGNKPVAGAAHAVRRFGHEQQIPEFTSDLVNLSGAPDPRMAAETLAFGAMSVLGAPGYIGAQASPEARVYFVPNDPQVPRASPDPVKLPRMLMTGAGIFGGAESQVVTGYFGRHGVELQRTEDGFSVVLPDGTPVSIRFDGQGRISSIDAHFATAAGR